MKIYEIREMSTDELIKRIQEEERNLVDLRFSHHLKQLTNTAKLKLVRRDIAKMKTVLRERELKALKETNNKTKEGAES
ncbi:MULTISPECIES: 50S ribosomal protein L29 [Ignavibacterium]|jgi:large subunit ribosomal protein L29|uniref:50S ribosomal protein L29 n=1 Tax=Ignavibacterium TaxID=795750 RepID=UPI0025C5208A|nr:MULTISPECIES: 50S ribosomal protein L29 [Ignavibacterium]MBI5661592.1 50S ribosomal protein L29 [Ignavibacterium album]